MFSGISGGDQTWRDDVHYLTLPASGQHAMLFVCCSASLNQKQVKFKGVANILYTEHTGTQNVHK